MPKRLIILVVAGLFCVVLLNACAASGASIPQPQEYLPLDTPEAPIYNIFLALQQGDADKAREQYTDVIRSAMDRVDRRERHGSSFELSVPKEDRLVILGKRDPLNGDPDKTYVTYKIVHYGDFWSSNRCENEVLVTRTEDGWKLDSAVLLYCPSPPAL